MTPDASTREMFSRALSAHLPAEEFQLLQAATVLVAGLGGGSNIAELLIRKGIGGAVIADIDVFESSNVRQRGSLASTWGLSKVSVMRERLLDVQPSARIVGVEEGVTLDNVRSLVSQSDYIIDMLDLHALQEKLALYDAARDEGKYVVTTPSVVNGASLWVFSPEGPRFDEFTGYYPGIPGHQYAWQLLEKFIRVFPEEASSDMYRAAAAGARTIPLDAVGVDQAAILAVSAIENLILDRPERVALVPEGVRVDLSSSQVGFMILGG